MTDRNNAPPYAHELNFARPFGWKKPDPDPGLMYRRGAFQGVMTPTEQSRLVGFYPDTVFLGLMIRLPRPDGTGGREVESYERQQVILEPRNNQMFCIKRPILFDIHRLPAVAGVALFDQATGGILVGYGAISSMHVGDRPNEQIHIPAYQLLVKRCVKVT